MHPADTLRLLGATMRLTRAIVVDDVGEWWVKTPIDNVMQRYHDSHTRPVASAGIPSSQPGLAVFDEPWWWKYRDGLECAHCVGFWVGAGVLLGEQIANGSPRPLRWAWRLTTGALALNTVSAHGGNLAGYYDGDEE